MRVPVVVRGKPLSCGTGSSANSSSSSSSRSCGAAAAALSATAKAGVQPCHMQLQKTPTLALV